MLLEVLQNHFEDDKEDKFLCEFESFSEDVEKMIYLSKNLHRIYDQVINQQKVPCASSLISI
jgi:hypothetical protein